MNKWVSDVKGNRCSVAKWGSIERTQEALDSLTNCWDCSNCSDCSNCYGCSNCSDCSNCYGCSNCWDCSDCWDCSNCSRERKLKAGITANLHIPIIPDIDAAIYAAASQPGALNMTTWHCGTAHCRAGWVVELAGEAGKLLENFHSTGLAALLIYAASGSPINPARFYDTAEDALADMKARAGKV